ncbi:MAG: sigma-70 family RNA polymerase sigma factor [Pleurocapsa minor GSE-CHR-MK-17-07R]|nr:sigma-70 family RNA polymerase sigma factor [Pleurocapsa minor GSE-CHR-MK 17-07R]
MTHYQQEQDLEADCRDVEAAKRSRAAFRPLFDRYYARIYGYVAARVGGGTAAEDITSETFRRALSGLGTFECRHEASFAGWIFRIASNEVGRHLARYASRYTVTLDEVEDTWAGPMDVEGDVQQRELLSEVQSMIGRLSPRRQEIISLRFYGELRNHEIAALLGLDERTVASHLCRAIDQLHHLYATTHEDVTR